MQTVSEEYANQIKKVPLRNSSYVEVTIGVINKSAQKSVKFADASYMDYSNLTKPFTEETVDGRYATYEEGYFIPGMRFIGTPYRNQGCVSQVGSGITLDLGSSQALGGLTINFGSKYPTEFTITTDSETIMATNHSEIWVYDIGFTTRYITITPTSFIGGGSGRLRIENFKCGQFITFTNSNILSLTYSEQANPVSAETSQNTLDFKVSNYNRKFDIERSNDLTRYFENGQDITLSYGYQLNDGTIEYLDYGNLSLESWEVDSTEVSFKGNSFLNLNEDICLIGEYSSSGKTLYALAEEVFEDLGITNYEIDNRLANFTSHSPLPQTTHSQLLQLIANAGQCICVRDRDNSYRIIPTCFATEGATVSVSDNGHTTGSNPSAIISLSEDVSTNYIADYSQDYFRNNMYFGGNENQGYVSSLVSDSEGAFTTNPKLTFTFSKAIQITSLGIDFVGAKPQTIMVTSYNGSTKLVEKSYTIDKIYPTFTYNFGYCDKLELEITKGSPNARVHIAKVDVMPLVFTFTSTRDVIGSSKATLLASTKLVELEGTTYTKGSTIEDVYTEDIEIQSGLDYSSWGIVFSECVSPTSVTVNGTTVTPIKLTGQHTVLNLSSYSVGATVSVVVKGYKLTTQTKIYRSSVSSKGTTESYQNPLVDNDSLGQANVKWLGIYHGLNREYSIESRGYPALELNDLVGLEIPQLNKTIKVRLTERSLSFEGGALNEKDIALKEE